MSNLEIFCIIYGIGFILNSLIAVHLIERLKVEQPEKSVSPVIVMVCVFLSWLMWVYIIVYAVVRWIKSLFRHDA